MKNFIMSNLATILILACSFGYVLYLVINRKWEQLRSGAYKLILEAERVIIGTKRGKERFDYVLNRLYLLIPGWLQFFLSEESLREKLQEWYNSIKDYMDNGKIDKSIAHETKPHDTI